MTEAKWWTAVTVVSLACAAALTAYGTNPRVESCELLQTAQDEAQMAEAWHLRAGKVLDACGVKAALATAESKACYARRFNDDSVKCD